MKSKKGVLGIAISKILLLTAVLFLVVTSHADTSLSAPKSAQTCVACHGMDGNSINPLWPDLAGQKPGYLADQLKSFRAGVRTNDLMAPLVKALSDQDINELAAYYASRPLKVAANGNADKVSAGEHASAYCVSCHGMKGQTANSEWPNLAGQQAAYLQQQLTAFRDGARISTNMNTIVAGYTDEQIEALAAFYSQLQP